MVFDTDSMEDTLVPNDPNGRFLRRRRIDTSASSTFASKEDISRDGIESLSWGFLCSKFTVEPCRSNASALSY